MARAIQNHAADLRQSTQGSAVSPHIADADVLRDTSLVAFARFATGVVHEVNNPLGVALLSAQHALRHLPDSAPPQLAQSLERVVLSVRRASEAVRTMLDVCREDEGDDQPNVWLDIRDVLRFTTLVMQSIGKRNGCRVTWQLSREPSLVCGNPLELEIVLASLIYEAIDAGASVVDLQSRAAHEWIEVSVHAEAVNRDPPTHFVVESGIQADETVSRIVQQHGGTICREQCSPHVSTATIRLPRILPEKSES